MRLPIIVVLASGTSCFPGMGALTNDLSQRQTIFPQSELIGDLVDGATTTLGRQVRDCITGRSSCESQSSKDYTVPGPLGSDSCIADACCVWDFVQRDLVDRFRNGNGTCNDFARASVRLGFHDAGAWSTASGFGGADGSLLLNGTEIDRPENNGLQNIRDMALEILDNYSDYGIGAADLVQFMHNIATVVCPLGPRILTLVGRRDDRRANPENLVPANNMTDADALIRLFEDKTFTPRALAALLGAHTVARQSFFDPSRAGQPLDSTPGVWDINFYRELESSSPPSNVFRLPSDEALAQDDDISSGISAFSSSTSGQTVWNSEYATAYVRLSLLGVNNINNLTDCTKVLPDAVTSFSVQPSATSSSPASTSTSPSTTLPIPKTWRFWLLCSAIVFSFF